MNNSTKAITLAGVLLTAVVVTTPRAEAATNAQVSVTGLSGKVTRVIVADDIGDVTVKTGARHSVTTMSSWNTEKPKVTVTFKRGVVTVRATCPSSGPVNGVNVGDNDCSVDVTVIVPKTADVKSTVSVGNLFVRGTSGSVDLESDTGDVAVTSTGRSIHTDASVGNTKISVPAGIYDYRAQAETGTVSVQKVRYRRGAPRVIRAHSDTGDIRIVGSKSA